MSSDKKATLKDGEEPVRRPSPLRLVRIEKGCAAAEFPIVPGEMVIGRDEECDVVALDPRASKRHAVLRYEVDEAVVTDLDSSNGTRVNEHPVRAQVLRHGCTVRVGQTIFLCLSAEPPGSRVRARPKRWLYVEAPGRGKTAAPVSEDPLVIGSADEADVCLKDEGVAPYHAQVVAVPGGVQYTDLSGERLNVRVLREGEHVLLGDIRLLVRGGDSGAPSAAPAAAKPPRKAGVPIPPEPKPRRAAPPPEPLPEESLETISMLAERGALRGELEEEAEFADLAAPSSDADLDAPSPKIKGLVLTARGGPADGKDFRFVGKALTIGRDPGCGIRLDDPNVSREHARIERHEGDVVVQDLDSANGVFLNDKRIRRRPIRAGDRIRVGQTEFLIHL